MHTRPPRWQTLVATLFLGAIPLTSAGAAAERPSSSPLKNVTAHRDLAYVSASRERQRLDVFVPSEGTAPLASIVWIHGGAWRAGNKDDCPPLRASFAQYGFVVASVGNRLSSDAIFPAQIEDCKAAIRWLRAHATEYRIDPDHIRVWGSSTGGHLVALLGPTDATMNHDGADSPESMLVGGVIQLDANGAAVRRANPITYVNAGELPFLIVHGDHDLLVPHHQSELLFDALTKVGGWLHFITVRGGGHGTAFPNRELNKTVRSFFTERFAEPSTPAPGPRANRSTTNAAER